MENQTTPEKMFSDTQIEEILSFKVDTLSLAQLIGIAKASSKLSILCESVEYQNAMNLVHNQFASDYKDYLQRKDEITLAQISTDEQKEPNP